jgi:hypothetical protein
MKKFAPLVVLIAIALAAWFYVRTKASEKTANREAVRQYCVEICTDWDECMERVIDRFDSCFTNAYRQNPVPGGDALVAETFAGCMNTRDFAERKVFNIDPGEVTFPTR